MKDLKTEIVVKILENNYVVKFPTVGQFIEIETRKSSLSKQQYRSMVVSGLPSANLALDFIDSIAVFTTLIPQLLKDLRVESMLELNPVAFKAVADQYRDVYIPWYKEWEDAIRGVVENKTEKKDDKEEE